jgi:hypothetical protein
MRLDDRASVDTPYQEYGLMPTYRCMKLCEVSGVHQPQATRANSPPIFSTRFQILGFAEATKTWRTWGLEAQRRLISVQTPSGYSLRT